jgi:hypothetical protein
MAFSVSLDDRNDFCHAPCGSKFVVLCFTMLEEFQQNIKTKNRYMKPDIRSN